MHIERLVAIRGAVQIAADNPDSIALGTMTLLGLLLEHNAVQVEDFVSLFFTVTPDLLTELPPLVAQEQGWREVPMLCSVEAQTPQMIPRTVRALAHVRWQKLAPVHSVYLPESIRIRPYLSAPELRALNESL